MNEWEDVCGPNCSLCGERTGTVWKEEERGTVYTVLPHGYMGNKSFREDRMVGYFCPSCGWKISTRRWRETAAVCEFVSQVSLD